MNKKMLIAAALVASSTLGAIGGVSLNAIQTFAQSPTPSTTSQNQQMASPPYQGQFDPSKGGHMGSNGKKEELLTGDTAEKVKAAALAAVSGGTVKRVETDAEGSPYEAHMSKADGSEITVKLDSNFKVTSIEDGAR